MTITRRILMSALFLVAAGGAVHAATQAAFTAAALKAAQDAGRPILVEVTAPWCPTCRAQKPILQSLLAEPRFRDTQLLSVDFDSQKDALRQLGVSQQSTLIVYRGARELGRSTGVTDPKAIEALLARTL